MMRKRREKLIGQNAIIYNNSFGGKEFLNIDEDKGARGLKNRISLRPACHMAYDRKRKVPIQRY
jgi:hypothetical protein